MFLFYIRFGQGSVEVWLKFGQGLVEVWSWYGRSSVEVWSWFGQGSVEVRLKFSWGLVEDRLRFGQGSVKVQSRFGFEVQVWTLVWGSEGVLHRIIKAIFIWIWYFAFAIPPDKKGGRNRKKKAELITCWPLVSQQVKNVCTNHIFNWIGPNAIAWPSENRFHMWWNDVQN